MRSLRMHMGHGRNDPRTRYHNPGQTTPPILSRRTSRGARASHGRSRVHSILALILLWLCVADATGEDGQERALLFNTRGLAVSTTVSFGMYFAQAALLKLAFIITQIREKGLDAGVLLELICNGQQAKFLIRWFRQRGYGLKVLVGESRDLHGIVRNGVGVFYKFARFKPVVGVSGAEILEMRDGPVTERRV